MMYAERSEVDLKGGLHLRLDTMLIADLRCEGTRPGRTGRQGSKEDIASGKVAVKDVMAVYVLEARRYVPRGL